MPNFVYDSTSLAFPKSDLFPIGGSDPNKHLMADNWNEAMQAMLDLRGAIKQGMYFGFSPQGSDPAPSGISSYLFATSTQIFFKPASGPPFILGTAGGLVPSGPAGGQLGGTYPNPDVRGVRETSGPTLLTMGPVSDGFFLKRQGSTIIGAVSAGGVVAGQNVGNAGVGPFHDVTGSTITFRNIAGASARVPVTLDSVNNNVLIDVSEASLSLSNFGGTLPVSKGGTGQTLAGSAFTALAPTATSIGTLLVWNGTAWAILPPGSDDRVLTRDSSQALGVKWGVGGGGGGGGTPEGPTGAIQFNDDDEFGGSANLVYNGSTVSILGSNITGLIVGNNSGINSLQLRGANSFPSTLTMTAGGGGGGSTYFVDWINGHIDFRSDGTSHLILGQNVAHFGTNKLSINIVDGDLTKIKGIGYRWPTNPAIGSFLKISSMPNPNDWVLTWEPSNIDPGGPLNAVQFNSNGSFGGSANLTWGGTKLNIIGGEAGIDISLVSPSPNIERAWNITTSLGGAAGTSGINFEDGTNTSMGGIGHRFASNGIQIDMFSAVQLDIMDTHNSQAVRMRVLKSGNVSIGSTTTTSMFNVGSAAQFQVNSSGDIIKIKNVAYSWPAADAAGVLTSNGSGGLSWVAGGSGAAGNEGNIQYKSGGAFAGSDNLQFDQNIGLPVLKVTATGTNASQSGATVAHFVNTSNAGEAGIKMISNDGAFMSLVMGNSNAGYRRASWKTSGLPFYIENGLGSGAGSQGVSPYFRAQVVGSDIRVGIGTASDAVPAEWFSVGTTSQFRINSSGNITRIRDQPMSWPAANASGVLTNDGSGGLSWGAGGGGSSPLTTKGDLYTYTTADARLPVGTNGQYLQANSATTTGLEWVTVAPAGGAGGSNGSIQFNDGVGGFAGTDRFTWDGSSLFLRADSPATNEMKDSRALVFVGHSDDGGAFHDPQWRIYNDVFSLSAASDLVIQHRENSPDPWSTRLRFMFEGGLVFTPSTLPNLSDPNTGRLVYQQLSQRFWVSKNGSNYQTIAPAVLTHRQALHSNVYLNNGSAVTNSVFGAARFNRFDTNWDGVSYVYTLRAVARGLAGSASITITLIDNSTNTTVTTLNITTGGIIDPWTIHETTFTPPAGTNILLAQVDSPAGPGYFLGTIEIGVAITT